MSKCPVCHSRKAKRKCLITEDNNICSLCCGQIRKEESCSDCRYYQSPKLRRKYNETPAYSTMQMEANYELQSYSDAIESALGAFDRDTGEKIKDDVALGILKRLIDLYHYKDDEITFESPIVEDGFHYVNNVIKGELALLPEAQLIKILGVLHFVANRRTQGGREYLTVIHRYVGERVAPGVRVISGFEKL